jgi:inhibitor of cysteine peptidase
MVKVMRDRSLAILAIAFVVFVCAGLAAAYAFSGSNSMKVFDDRNNTQTITIKNGESFKVQLNENPTTGYAWIINLTPGLTLVNDTYIAPSGGLMGAGGQHEWQVKATGTGDQQLTGIYKRSWEPTSGNETTYRLNIKIE